MLKQIVAVWTILLIVMLSGCEDEAPVIVGEPINGGQDESCSPIAVNDLMAGDKKVGTLSIMLEGDTLRVTYFTEPGVYIRYLRYHIGTALNDIPRKNGEPDLDNFAYDEDTRKLLLSGITGNSGFNGLLYFAAYAKIAFGNVLYDGEATINIKRTHKLGDPSYFVTTLNIPGALTTDNYGYCLQGDQRMDATVPHTVELLSSLSIDTLLLDGVIDLENNLDMVNWVLNQKRSEWMRSDGVGASGADVQMAIWRLIEATGEPTGVYLQNKFEPEVVDKIVSDARFKGDGFRPVCGQKELIILHRGPIQPLGDNGDYNTGEYGDPDYQVSGIVKTIECSNEERDAWAEGSQLGDTGFYFVFCID